MDDIRFQKIIQDLELQGQTWVLCCYPSFDNKNFISINRMNEENIVCIKAEDTLFSLKKRKPEYILIAEPDYDLIDKTAFIYEWGGKHILLKEDIIMERCILFSR